MRLLTAPDFALGMNSAGDIRMFGPPHGEASPGADCLDRIRVILLCRWVLIIATSYLVIFNQPRPYDPTPVGLFIIAYFASNVLLSELLPRLRSSERLDVVLVLFDTAMVSIGVALSKAASTDFYVLYFGVIFLSALTEQLGLVLGAVLLITAAHMYTESRFLDGAALWTPASMLRIPFLFVVAMFFGHLVREARARTRVAEEVRARARRMEFLSGVSHDIRSPLNNIQLLCTLLLDSTAGPLSDRQMDLVRRVHASTRHVITFALNLIDAARIEAGKVELLRTPTDVGELIENALSLACTAAEIKHVTLETRIAPDLPTADLDRLQMERVISNLIGNAIKFSNAGDTVTVSAQRAGDRVVVEVRDTGCGIPAAELANAFEKYRRGTATQSVEGSGLGLFIVQAIVEAHHGSITLHSSVGAGTTVTVTLPLASPATVAAVVGPAARPAWWWRWNLRRPGRPLPQRLA